MLARADFPWDQKDTVELSFQVGSRNTQQRAPQVQPQQFGGFNINQLAMQKQPTGGNRQRKTESNFAIPNFDAFDALLNDGFTMLENDQILIKRANAQVPREADTVTVSYVAFIWDCQNQKFIEFASSDLPYQQKK